MAEKNRPLAMGPAQILAGSSNTTSVPTTPDARLVPLIGSTVEKPLDAALWRLRAGEIGIEDLTPGLAGFCTLFHADGYAAGTASAAVELQQAISDRDRYYRAAFDPRKPMQVGPSYAELEKTRHEIYSGGAK